LRRQARARSTFSSGLGRTGFSALVAAGGKACLLQSKAFTYKCADCGRQTSVSAGTIMHASKLPLTICSGRLV
jgi:DNA-directed RNA polymerase subunit RPC12/RpoP